MTSHSYGLSQRKLPIYLSSEIAECGLACLAMIGTYLGHHLDLNALRQRYPVSAKGLTLRSMIQIADDLDITTRALKISADALPSVPTPCILHWGGNHFVILKKFGHRRVIVHDPSRGVIRYSSHDFQRNFSGIVLELVQKREFSVIIDKRQPSIKDFWHKNSGYGSYVTMTVLLSLFLQAGALTVPLSNQIVIDKIVLSGDITPLPYVFVLFSLLIVFQLCADVSRSLTASTYSARFDFQISYNTVSSLFKNKISFFSTRNLGDLVSRITSTDEIKDTIAKTYITIAIDGIAVISCFALMTMFSPFLAITSFVLSSTSVLLAMLAFPAQYRANSDKVVQAAAEQTHLMESIRGIQTIKMYDLEQSRSSMWRELRAMEINAGTRSQNISAIIESIKVAVSALIGLTIITIGAREVLTNARFTIGMLISFLIYARLFSDRLSTLLTAISRLRLLGLHLDRLSDIVAPPDARDMRSHGFLDSAIPFAGGIEFKDVWFRYSKFDAWVLKGVSFSLVPGDFVAVVGESGGGKTTLLRILLGLLSIESGEIIMDGKTADTETFSRLRAQIGVVSQDDSFFTGSIRENIILYRSGYSLDDVKAAARRAHISDYIETLPMKYETLIGDMGSSLSAGQKQRILLARALLANPVLLLLDEGTANLDAENEKFIVETVSAMKCTRLSITHRPSFSEAAAKVYCVSNGLITQLK